MQIFRDNPYPKHLYKVGVPNGLYVSDKLQLEKALQDGFSETYVVQEWPKWVGPPDEQICDPALGTVTLVSKGGGPCHNAKEEKERLALLAKNKHTE